MIFIISPGFQLRSTLLWLVCAVWLTNACSQKQQDQEGTDIPEELTTVLREHVTDLWYPRAIDSIYGGYLSDFNYQWEPDGPQNKMIVSQARHVWTCSRLEELYPGMGYADYAAHGVSFLKNTMWDQEYGGFHSLVNREGNLIENAQWSGRKTAYGNAFGIYGLSAYARVTGDREALELAKKAFRWLDSHSYDQEFGGYFQFLSREGQPGIDGLAGVPPKDQNSTIHLLEAFTELYQVWPNDTLRNRLQEMLTTVRDVIAGYKGYMNLFFNRDWTPVVYRDSLPEVREANYSIDHVSFGHDIETAYLIMEASEILGLGHHEETFTRGKQMVDHVLDNGWDQEIGGVYDRGYYFSGTDSITIITDSKVWWSQVEALNTLLIMSQLYPSDPRDYYSKFELQWDYIKTYLLDHEYGGVFNEGIDKSPESKDEDKGGIWKVNYHTARSLINCIELLDEPDTANAQR